MKRSGVQSQITRGAVSDLYGLEIRICGFGDTSRNAYWGPGFFDVDASIMKNWVLKEDKTFQFRWDFFNATNHPNFGNPASTVNQAAGVFGVVTGTNGHPRVLQGALRLTF